MPYFITDKCIGCTACVRNCPVFAIDGKPKERHVVNIRRCVSCGVCGRVCPKGAILDGHEQPCAMVPRAQWKKPFIDRSVCSACGLCVTHCRFGALRISDPAFHADIHVFAELRDEKKCVGCGQCAEECPLHAITMREVEA